MRIRLMTWNIHKCIGFDGRFRPERVIAAIRHHEPDVLLMQEVDRGVPRSRRLWLDHFIAEAAGFEFHAWSQNHALKEGGYGNATLSRFPIRRKRVIDLTVAWRKQRGCIYTRLNLPGHWGDLHVFNWHLGLSALERRSQVQRTLRSGTARAIGKEARVILGGDTNDWRNLLFKGAGLKDAGFHARSEHGRKRHLKTYPAVAPVGPLDKFFWRGPFEEPAIRVSRTQVARIASDHLPLVGEFELVAE